jgi:hypothetical protein
MVQLLDKAVVSFEFLTNTNAEHEDFQHYIQRLQLRQGQHGLLCHCILPFRHANRLEGLNSEDNIYILADFVCASWMPSWKLYSSLGLAC